LPKLSDSGDLFVRITTERCGDFLAAKTPVVIKGIPPNSFQERQQVRSHFSCNANKEHLTGLGGTVEELHRLR
jgi:hypothetical protein